MVAGMIGRLTGAKRRADRGAFLRSVRQVHAMLTAAGARRGGIDPFVMPDGA